MPAYDARADRHCRVTKADAPARQLPKKRTAAADEAIDGRAKIEARYSGWEEPQGSVGEGARNGRVRAGVAEDSVASPATSGMAARPNASRSWRPHQGRSAMQLGPSRAALRRKTAHGRTRARGGGRTASPAAAGGHGISSAEGGASASVAVRGGGGGGGRSVGYGIATSPTTQGSSSPFVLPLSPTHTHLSGSASDVSLPGSGAGGSRASLRRVPSRYMRGATFPFPLEDGRSDESRLLPRRGSLRSVGSPATAPADEAEALWAALSPPSGELRFLGPLAALNDVGRPPLDARRAKLHESTAALKIRRDIGRREAEARARSAREEEERARALAERSARFRRAADARWAAYRRAMTSRRAWRGRVPALTAVHEAREWSAREAVREMARAEERARERAEGREAVADSYREQARLLDAVRAARAAGTVWRGKAAQKGTTSMPLQRASPQGGPPSSPQSPQSRRRLQSPTLRRVAVDSLIAKRLGVAPRLVQLAMRPAEKAATGESAPSVASSAPSLDVAPTVAAAADGMTEGAGGGDGGGREGEGADTGIEGHEASASSGGSGDEAVGGKPADGGAETRQGIVPAGSQRAAGGGGGAEGSELGEAGEGSGEGNGPAVAAGSAGAEQEPATEAK